MNCDAGYGVVPGTTITDNSCTECAANQHSAGGTAQCEVDDKISCEAGFAFSNGGNTADGLFFSFSLIIKFEHLKNN